MLEVVVSHSTRSGVISNDLINAFVYFNFQPTFIEVMNESYMHNVPKGDFLIFHFCFGEAF